MMVASGSVAVPPHATQQTEKARLLASPELIDRLAADLRARSDTDLPHGFYVEQVRRQLTMQANENTPAKGEAEPRTGSAHPSVFHAWALSE